MIKKLGFAWGLLLFAGTTLFAAPPSAPTPSETNAAFARLKSLAGDWTSTSAKGEHSKLTYQVIAAGSAVMERFSSDALPATSGEMMTVYYLDGGELVLTHYCIAKNQPHMRATLYDSRTGELHFNFVSGGNMAAGGEGHMHSATLKFLDEDHLSTEWQYLEGGLRKFTEVAQFTRVK